MFGFLNIYKPKGITSHDVVSILRKITKIKQIGHTGTLDPFAQGVLPICIGKATRLIEYLQDDKEYIAQIQFGQNTDTYDIDGKVTENFDKKITADDLKNILPEFRGEISQLPPIYSAIKVNGKKLYDYARKGESIEIKPRKVTISKLELLDFDIEKQTAKIIVGCSKGTYIRSLAFDIGKKLGCGAFLSELTRTKAGTFNIENTVSLENLKAKEDVKNELINPIDILNLPIKELSENEKEKVSHGMSIQNTTNIGDLDIVILIYSGNIYAVGEIESNMIIVRKVFGEL